MNQDLDLMENTWLEELSSILESIRLTDRRIRQSVESHQPDEAYRLTAALVQQLEQKRITSDAAFQKLMDLRHSNVEQAVQIGRCRDMAVHLRDLLAKHLTIYQRMLVGLAEKPSAA